MLNTTSLEYINASTNAICEMIDCLPDHFDFKEDMENLASTCVYISRRLLMDLPLEEEEVKELIIFAKESEIQVLKIKHAGKKTNHRIL